MRKRLNDWSVVAFYWWATTTLRGLLWLVARWEVRGREHVPMEGPLIVVANHLNNTDPPILASGIARRRIRYMAKIELFKYPLGIIIRLFGAFPVRRFDADVGAMLNAERILRHGGVLGMFPEGTRSRTGYLGRPHPGTALIALRTGATVLPCAITGTEQIRSPFVVLRRPRITITIGTPLAIERVKRPTEAQVSALTERIFGEIRAMLPARYAGPYTGSDSAGEGQAVTAHGGDHPGE